MEDYMVRIGNLAVNILYGQNFFRFQKNISEYFKNHLIFRKLKFHFPPLLYINFSCFFFFLILFHMPHPLPFRSFFCTYFFFFPTKTGYKFFVFFFFLESVSHASPPSFPLLCMYIVPFPFFSFSSFPS